MALSMKYIQCYEKLKTMSAFLSSSLPSCLIVLWPRKRFSCLTTVKPVKEAMSFPCGACGSCGGGAWGIKVRLNR